MCSSMNSGCLQFVRILFLVLLANFTSFAEPNIFKQALIQRSHEDGTPAEIIFKTNNIKVSLHLFLNLYRKNFLLSPDITFRTLSVNKDELGQVHHRISQSYKGIEIPEIQMLVHEKEGSAAHVHGKFIHDLNIDVIPAQSEQKALQAALNYVNASEYMWEDYKNEAFIKQFLKDPRASFYPKGRLIITAGHQKMIRENLRLAYRFDIHTSEPYGGYCVDIDANNGEILNVLPLIYSGDVRGEGMSLYNDMVNITVSDTIPEAPNPPQWHLNNWMALDEGGLSWWVADTTVGGYAKRWYEVLDTDTFTLSGDHCQLSYYQRYQVKSSNPVLAEYDAWDGFNVRISTDGGSSWDILMNPEPAYTRQSIYSFGATYGEGPSIPGWAGANTQWEKVSFDLSAYSGKMVNIRFAFASDDRYATIEDIPGFGWQIDSILVINAQDTLFCNNGDPQCFTARNIAKDLRIILEGKYRLREENRGAGIATYDMQNQFKYYYAQDFVDDDSSFTDSYAQAGVSVHWASEAFYDYFLNTHIRLSYDDQNSRIVSWAHYYSKKCTNSFWHVKLNIAGYGDGGFNNMPPTSIDMVGHELTHGVTQHTANLYYRNQSGALNESFSDIFGTMIEFYIEGENGDWLIGEDFRPNGVALRSLENPAGFGHPDTYRGNNWFPEPEKSTSENDWGGVHTNNSVHNHWFYLLSEGGQGINDNGFAYDVNGIGKNAAAQIAYRNLVVYLLTTSNFTDARLGSMYSAMDIYGQNSAQLQAVEDAWDAVGVNLGPSISAHTDKLSFTAFAKISVDTVSLIINNYGRDTLIIDDIEISGSEFSLVSEVRFPLQLNSYENNLSLDLTFTPTSEGLKTDNLIIYSNDLQKPVFTIYLSGNGLVINPVQKNTIYAVTSKQTNSSLLKFDGSNDQWHIIGKTGYPFLTDISLNPLTNQLFGIYPQSNKSIIIRIDAKSGAAYCFATIPIGEIRKIAFDPNGNLYGIDANYGDLYLINLTTGDTIHKGRSRRTNDGGLAINPLTGSLWASNDDGMIYKLDKSNAQLTRVGRTEFLACQSITFDANGGLFGLSRMESVADTIQIFSINTINANAKLFSTTGYTNVAGLVITGVVITDIDNDLVCLLPQNFRLEQNHPNPFNPRTGISYRLPVTSHVDLSIYNTFGQKVATLVSGKQPAGNYKVEWDAAGFSSGLYLYQITAGKWQDAKKMVLLK